MNDALQRKLENEIAYLKRLNSELLDQLYEDDAIKFPWMGNLGQWFWDCHQNIVTFNPLKARRLGYLPEDVPEETGFEFFTDKLHPDDYDEVMDKMRAHTPRAHSCLGSKVPHSSEGRLLESVL